MKALYSDDTPLSQHIGALPASAAPVAVAQEARPVLLHAEHIRISYPGDEGERIVLNDFSLALREQEFVAIIGPSGVGKSSLLRILSGLQTPQAGQVRLNEQAISQPHPDISFVFQDPNLLPWLNVSQNIAYGMNFKRHKNRSRQEIDAAVAEAIDTVKLDGFGSHYPSSLSGGMAQRVALARSLARRPRILMLDEPLSALDEITRAQMQQLLLDTISHYRASAVMVTHDIDEALTLADRIILLDKNASAHRHWSLMQSHPRDVASPEFLSIRADIVHTLRNAFGTGA
ncbi:ABC transporter ATP-binding protein [Advenella mimigardefordensis]|uniref:Putative ABC-type nitrate/sulfonate/bicarbonate transport ATP-binding protein n=1 Tax=Advenella mimigardefordensis (strain DSM 17166 / LMG 22922 / DPN7) TaxID=1247726 RepID=W0PAA4_ADVMD|nr:ABC transporter ATP-binding protein [Advenella mimigardefordensis]AHG63764.1 putative ABC-type nitrate/sulfonate/bicarbonate transport ATP-binding protein [Advenella mimigardefordensis DPN7]